MAGVSLFIVWLVEILHVFGGDLLLQGHTDPVFRRDLGVVQGRHRWLLGHTVRVMRCAVNTRSYVGNVRSQAVVAYFRASKGPL